MLQLYNVEPISISFLESDRKIMIEFCNVKMNMNPCQFKLFNRYLTRLQRGIDAKTEFVEMQMVKDSLKVKIALEDFLKLVNGVETALINKFGYKPSMKN
tara:strand:+ start:241 stop:540 length:300 start_codon:yes stop_codon:yes gene_type:complete